MANAYLSGINGGNSSNGISQTDADNRYLRLTGGTIADDNDALNIAPYALKFGTSVKLNSSGTLNLSAVGQNNGVIEGLAAPTQDNHAVNKAYVDSLTFSVLDTVVDSFTDVSGSNFVSVIDLDIDNINFADSNSPIIYFQYQNQGLKETLNSNIENILANSGIYLDIPTPTTERYPLYKLPEPLPSLQEGNSTTTIYYSSGVIYLETNEQILIPFIVLAGEIMKNGDAPSSRLVFISLNANP